MSGRFLARLGIWAGLMSLYAAYVGWVYTTGTAWGLAELVFSAWWSGFSGLFLWFVLWLLVEDHCEQMS